MIGSTLTRWSLHIGNLRWLRREADAILRRADALRTYSDEGLRHQIDTLRWDAKCGRPLHHLLAPAFAAAIAAAQRTIGQRPYPVQVMGAIALFHGRIIEMQTGEGKTLTAVLPVVLRALPGRGCHVITANNYLAQRDAEAMGSVFQRLGLSVGCVLQEMETDQRREQYARDITYGTGSEMGFDFLRDRLRRGTGPERPPREIFKHPEREAPVLRGHYFGLVDEADGLLIDDARTPLIIGMEYPDTPPFAELYRWSHAVVRALTPREDFVFEPDKRAAWLTEQGCRKLTLLTKPPLLDSISTERIYDQVEQSLVAEFGFHRNRDYVLDQDKVVIVSESTGRRLDSRKWQAGLHQAVEAKERVPVTPSNRTTARVTVQSYFAQYHYLAGMTGTATPARAEFRRYYRTGVTVIPTHRPCLRQARPPRVFVGQQAKRDALVAVIRELVAKQRPVLVGTPSVRASEALSAQLSSAAIDHVVLNALQDEHEAAVVAAAGQPGTVTIATNMAGRGTDIVLHEITRRCGGLHVLATEMHSSARIDRQLVGRAARQGDPGSYQFFLSLEDELIASAPPQRVVRWRAQARPDQQGELPTGWANIFRRLQHRLERTHARQRRKLFDHERQRTKRLRQAGFDPFLEWVE